MVVAQREGVLERSCKFLFFTFLAVCSLTCQYASASSPTRVKRIIVSDEIYQPQVANKVAGAWCGMNTFAKLLFGDSTRFTVKDIEKYVGDINVVKTNAGDVCKVGWSGGTRETAVFFRQAIGEKYAFDITQGTNATSTLYELMFFLVNTDAIQYLIDNGAAIDEHLKDDETLLFVATIANNTEAIKVFARNGLNVNQERKSLGGHILTTPLYDAVDWNKPDVVKTLLALGAEPNKASKMFGHELGDKTPIIRSVPLTDPSISKILIEYGVKLPETVFVKDVEMPLVWAVVKGNPENTVERLDVWLSNGADVNATWQGETILDWAEQNGRQDVVELLKRYDAKNGTKSESMPETKKDKRLFRYKQCELENTPEYCDCLIGHVSKAIGWIDEMVWLSGGALTDASGRQALVQAGFLCAGLNKKTPTYQEQKAQEETGMFNGGKYKVSDLKFCDGIFGRAVCGVIENLTGQQQDVLLVYVNLYDADNIRVGEGMANINTVAPHEKIRFETVGDIDDSVVSFKVREIMD